MKVNWKYKPNKKQEKFHLSPATARLYGGAAGGGKSHGIVHEAVMQSMAIPNNRGVLFRRTFPELEKSLIHTLRTHVPEELYKYNGTSHTATFINGSILEFSFLENDNDVYRYQSAEYGFMGFDELTHFTEFQFNYLVFSRLRAVTDGCIPNVFCGTNPGNIGHSWVKRVWIDEDRTEAENGAFTYEFIPALVYDNEVLMKRDPNYVKRLEALPEDKKKALLYGDWDIFEGQYFKEWRKEVHVIPPLLPPDYYNKYRAIDWGGSAPFCCLWGSVDPDGNVIIYREHYMAEKDTEWHRDHIVTMSGKENYTGTVGDPSMWSPSPIRGRIPTAHNENSIADTLINYGGKGLSDLIRAPGGPNSRISGWDVIRQHLQWEGHRDNDGKLILTKKPKVYVTESCPNLIRTFPGLVYDKIKTEDCDTNGEDHAPDALRYMMAYMKSPKRVMNDDYHYDIMKAQQQEIPSSIYEHSDDWMSGNWA